jgi:hypothetical protein
LDADSAARVGGALGVFEGVEPPDVEVFGVELVGVELLLGVAGIEDSGVRAEAVSGGATSRGVFTAALGAAFTSGGVYGFSTGVSFLGVRDTGVRGKRATDSTGAEWRSLAAGGGAGGAAFASLDFPALSFDAVLLGVASPAAVSRGALPLGTAAFGAALALGAFTSGAAFPAGGAEVSGAMGAAADDAEGAGCAGATVWSFVVVLGVGAGAFEEAGGAVLLPFIATAFTWFSLS